MSNAMIDNAQNFPNMDGPAVFKVAVEKFPEVIMEALNKNNFQTSDLKLLIPHQANLRISQFVQRKLSLTDDQVNTNIKKNDKTIRYYQKLYKETNSDWLATKQSLVEFQQVCSQNNIHCCIALLPLLYQLDGAYPFQNIHEL